MKYTKEILQAAIDSSKNISDVLVKLDLKCTGSNHRYIKKRIIHYDINTSHFIKHINRPKGLCDKLSYKQILVKDRLKNREEASRLRRALVESGVEEICVECGGGKEWNNKYICLQIDHLNGDIFDNRKENLRFLCPNCHTQTDNYAGKNSKKYKLKLLDGKKPRKTKRPALSILEPLIWNMPATKIAKQFNVSDKAVEKWCKFYNINKPSRGYWMKH